VFDGSSKAALGVTAAGGPQDAGVQGNQIVWKIAGVQPGARTLVLPGTWYPDQAAPQQGKRSVMSIPVALRPRPSLLPFHNCLSVGATHPRMRG
jgi:hypothetical protein